MVKKIFGDHQIFWWFGSCEHVNRLKKLFEDTKVKIRSESRSSACSTKKTFNFMKRGSTQKSDQL